MRFEKEWVFDEQAESPLPATREGSPSVRIDMSVYSDDDYGDVLSGDEFTPVSAETDEGRLSRSLQSWMPEHVWTTVEPLERPPVEPVFSGRLGRGCIVLPKVRPGKSSRKPRTQQNGKIKQNRPKTAPLRRAKSNDSIVTRLSLMSCSSREEVVEEKLVDSKRRRRRRVASRCSTTTTTTTTEEHKESVWVVFAMKTGGALSRLMRSQAALGMAYGNDMDHESEAFRLLDSDEQEALYECGRTRGIVYIKKAVLKRSSSCGTIKNDIPHERKSVLSRKRTLSACTKHPHGKTADIGEFKREQLRRRMAIEQARLDKEKGRRLRRHPYRRSSSGTNVLIDNVPDGTHTLSIASVSGHSGQASDNVSQSSDKSVAKEEKVSVWKGDQGILEIDLKKELTNRVKKRIDSTRAALKRATGMGDSNEQRRIVGKHDEFPKHIEEDFSHRPRIVQKMRISPHLSGVIHNDIQVRMGRPRYHEIRIADLTQWNKGHQLNRAHRNLKVFNWLHSLRESEFDGNVAPEIFDDIPDEEASKNLELLHVESADEPDAKPMFRQYEVRIL